MKEEKLFTESKDEKQLVETKSGKPFYKKAWFWVIVVIFVVLIGSQSKQAEKVGENKNSGSNGSSQVQNNEPKKEEKTEFKVERNWDSGNTYMKPKDGKEYVKVTVKIENKFETEMNYNVFEFKAEDSNGAAESADGQTYSLPDSLGSGDLVKGGRKTGSMIFEVPAGSQIKLHYQPSFWSNKKVIVNL